MPRISVAQLDVLPYINPPFRAPVLAATQAWLRLSRQAVDNPGAAMISIEPQGGNSVLSGPDMIEHLERQAHFLSMIPVLAAKVARLSEEIQQLRDQHDRVAGVHEALAKQKPGRKSTGPPRLKNALGRRRPAG